MKKILFLDGCKCIDPVTKQKPAKTQLLSTPMTILPKDRIELDGILYTVYDDGEFYCVYLPHVGFMEPPDYQLIKHIYELIKEKKEDCQ